MQAVRSLAVLALLSFVIVPVSASAQSLFQIAAGEDPYEAIGEAAFFRLEEDIVTSASKYAQSIIESPSAISIITKEDIQQSGTLDITQLFRFHPGILVTEGTMLGRDIMIRGYPQEFSPRLLVLYDGVPLYTPLFSGVTWGFVPVSLPSIERIEIIRGASSTLYGANAFSGVINIISKKIEPKQSFHVYAAAGNLELVESQIVWNRPISDAVRLRLSGFFRRDNGYGANNGDSIFDGQTIGQGFLDFEFDLAKDTKMEFYNRIKGGQRREPFGFAGNQTDFFYDLYSGIRLAHDFTENRSLSFQGTFHEVNQSEFTTTPSFQTRREAIADLQFTNRFGSRDTLVSGTSFRHGGYTFLNFTPNPPSLQKLTLASFFVNNDFKILDNLILTTGGRYEYDSFTKSQLAGRGNLTYSPWKNQAFRASVARAVRTPSVIEERMSVLGIPGVAPPPLPSTAVVDILGNRNLKTESVLAFEAGYLGKFFDNRLNANLQFYFNKVYDLITIGISRVDLTATPPSVTANFNNRNDGQIYGLETDLTYQVFDWWKTSLNYTLTRQLDFETGQFPKNILNFKNRFMFKKGFSAELLFNWTSPYRFFQVFTATAQPIGHIFRLDARIAQKFFKDRFEFAVVGQNLIDAPHSEQNTTTRIDRLIYGVLSFKY